MKIQKFINPKAIADHFATHFSEIQKTFPDQDFYQYLYFITARFDVRDQGNSARNQLEEFGKLYFRLARKLFGNNLGRKRRKLPLCYAFLDAEGSRQGASDIFNCQMPHVHGIILIQSQHRQQFEEAFSKSNIEFLQTARHVEISSFDYLKGSLDNLISYSMKGYRHAQSSHFQKEDLWEIFPR